MPWKCPGTGGKASPGLSGVQSSLAALDPESAGHRTLAVMGVAAGVRISGTAGPFGHCSGAKLDGLLDARRNYRHSPGDHGSTGKGHLVLPSDGTHGYCRRARTTGTGQGRRPARGRVIMLVPGGRGGKPEPAAAREWSGRIRNICASLRPDVFLCGATQSPGQLAARSCGAFDSGRSFQFLPPSGASDQARGQGTSHASAAGNGKRARLASRPCVGGWGPRPLVAGLPENWSCQDGGGSIRDGPWFTLVHARLGRGGAFGIAPG